MPIPNIWKEESIKKEALLYTNRSSFRENSSGAYAAAVRLDILDKVCSHMIIPDGYEVERLVYVYEFSDNHA